MSETKKAVGMVAYTRRRQRDGMVKVFFRSIGYPTASWQLVVHAEAAQKIPPNRPMTIEQIAADSR